VSGPAADVTEPAAQSGESGPAAAGMAAGWLVVIAAGLIAVSQAPARWVVPALGLGNSAGLTVAGIALAVAVTRGRGTGALRGAPRAAGAGLAAALAGAAAGTAVAAVGPGAGRLASAGLAAAAAGSAAIVFGAVACALDRRDLRVVLAALRRRAVPS
jgi:putative peptidoglycan lipid II flippase